MAHFIMLKKPEEQLFILKPDDKENKVFDNLIGYLAGWGESFSLEVTVKLYRKNRTALQNRFLHGWIFRLQIMKKLNDSGQEILMPDGSYVPYDVDILKEIFKQDCIIEQIEDIKTVIGPKGDMIKVPVHPSKYNTADFSKYCDLVMYYAMQWYGIEVEPPFSGRWLTIYQEMKNA